ncbi:MAG: GPI anchored serine-threonine rich family protein, partial [Candidatus Delongbacteria bacterium]|nr:GPI anchored serine-threonine rich family protein [Candidatus Delongbacteria bacterium]MCG2761472.1 GPI anchored serine-threonine rich family protein [Candidatus Delongbacteria bacterium]
DSLVKIDLYRNFSKVITISDSTENDSYFLWTIPTSLTLASDYLVRIEGLTTTVYDYSNDGFKITNTPYIQVTSPNGGETWTMGTDQTITWQDNLTEDVKIELFRGSNLALTINDSTASNGSYSWNIPDSLTAGANYKVMITSIPVNAETDESDTTFSIVVAP